MKNVYSDRNFHGLRLVHGFKITKAADYIGTVKHYMEYVQMTDGQPEVVDDMPMELPNELPPEGM